MLTLKILATFNVYLSGWEAFFTFNVRKRRFCGLEKKLLSSSKEEERMKDEFPRSTKFFFLSQGFGRKNIDQLRELLRRKDHSKSVSISAETSEMGKDG